MLKPIQIGNLKVKGNIFLAPMSRVTNIAFRSLCRKYGADLCFTEFVNSNAILNNENNSKLTTNKEDRPLGIQIFGNDEESLAKAAKQVQNKCDLIDLNLGCPAYQIIRQGSCSALLKDLKKLEKIVKKIVDSVCIPVTVKIRSGINEDNINAVEVAKLCERAGVKMITVHSRTQKQGYSGKADMGIIKKVKENVSIPVIANGDIDSYEKAKEVFEKTNCDGIMIGRAAMNNPKIFKEIKEGIKINVNQKELALEYLKLWRQYELSLGDLKLHLISLSHGFNGASVFRNKLSTIGSATEFEDLFNSLN